MGKIVNTLLQTGERNVQPNDSTQKTGQSKAATPGQPVATVDNGSLGATPSRPVATIDDESLGATPVFSKSSLDQESHRTGVGGDKVKFHHQHKSPDRTGTEDSRTTQECKETHVGSIGLETEESNVEIVSKGSRHSSVKELDVSPPTNSTEPLDNPPADDLHNSLTLSDSQLQDKWFLTFEQFVEGLNKEPELCQFFAEQNLMDLTGSSPVDPVLSSYTRTVLASAPL